MVKIWRAHWFAAALHWRVLITPSKLRMRSAKMKAEVFDIPRDNPVPLPRPGDMVSYRVTIFETDMPATTVAVKSGKHH